MKNIAFYGNDNLFWTYSTPNLAIPNKETLLGSKKQHQTLGGDLIIRPNTENTKSLGILDSLTNISSQLLLEAEEIQTESDEITKELPRIHLIKFDQAKSRLYEVFSFEHANITPYSMLHYNEQKRILLIGSKQKIELFDCNNNNTPIHINTWDLPSTLLGLKCEENCVLLLLGQQKCIDNTGASFLSFDTTTKYTNLELWNVTLPNMEKAPATSVVPTVPNMVSADTVAILSAIQSLQLLVEDQYRRVNERLDRLEAAMNLNSKQ
jgi:hypothetical protein